MDIRAREPVLLAEGFGARVAWCVDACSRSGSSADPEGNAHRVVDEDGP